MTADAAFAIAMLAGFTALFVLTSWPEQHICPYPKCPHKRKERP